MLFRKVLTNIRILTGCVFFALSAQNANAQYNIDNSDVEDWQLFDEEEEKDSTEKPKHTEWKNLLYIQYSPTQYTFPGCSPHLHFQEVSIGWARSIQIADSIPLFIEAGADVKYSYSAGDAIHNNSKYNLLTFRIPVNLTYKFYLSKTRNIALAPQAGVHFRAIAIGKEKQVDDQKYNLFNKNHENNTGAEWERCQLGWQVGLRLQLERFFIGVNYSRDFPDKSKKPHIHESGVTVGMCF